MTQLTTKGTFKHGMSIAGVVYTKFEMREAFMADVFDAEREAGCGPERLEFHGHLAMTQLVKVTDDTGRDYGGPFTLDMVKKKGDFMALRAAQDKLDNMGNVPAIGTETSGTKSS
jgi:hypothetical protein